MMVFEACLQLHSYLHLLDYYVVLQMYFCSADPNSTSTS
jgi:hypothetical protein